MIEIEQYDTQRERQAEHQRRYDAAHTAWIAAPPGPEAAALSAERDQVYVAARLNGCRVVRSSGHNGSNGDAHADPAWQPAQQNAGAEGWAR